MDELTLIHNCVKGDPVAQRKLFEKFAPKMMTVCLRYLKDVQEAEDVLQDGFIKIFQKIDAYQFTGSFEGWMRKIIVNTALDQIRRNRKMGFSEEFDTIEYKMESSDHIFEDLVAQDLMKLIANLPDGYKVVFNMFAIEGYSHKEIGELLGISENTSKSQFSRARAYLRNKLETLKIEYGR